MTGGIEAPIDRLHYFNGRRLAAQDLRLEQDYHIRVRRWLNRTLFTPGIADGLEVRVSPSSARRVVVSAGLAIDALGREVILVQDVEVDVVGVPATEADWVFGNYLTIEYAEETVAAVQDGCAVRTDRRDLAWGGPAIVRAAPVVTFQSAWPDEAGGKVLLAQVELGPGCEVTRIHNGVRKYVDAATPSVRAFGFEGEKDVDRQNPKVLRFHIRGGPPRSVLLYLWGERLSTLYYTELPAHTHPLHVTTSAAGQVGSHHHDVDLGAVSTDEVDPHQHDIEGSAFVESGDVSFRLRGGGEVVNLTSTVQARARNAGRHGHTVDLGTVQTGPAGQSGDHDHTISGETGSRGVQERGSGGARTSGRELTYVDGLKVVLDGNDITGAVLAQLGGPPDWAELGNGAAGHALVARGTGAIDLLRVGLALVEGEHTLELRVDNDSGGNVRYNLYVE